MAGKQSKRLLVLEALARGASITEAAAAAGVGERTVYRWRTDPVFRAELLARDGERLEQLARRLQDAADDALTVLRLLATDERVPPGVRVRAAAEILTYRLRFYEAVQLNERVRAIEQRLDEWQRRMQL